MLLSGLFAHSTNLYLHDYRQNPETGSIRDGFGSGLVKLAEKHPQVVALCADLTESVRMNYFEQTFPEHFIQVGVAEQNLVGLAAGMALAGKIPFAASFAAFSPGRSWDQLRVSVCYSNLNVKIVGGHAGLSVGEDGATHQMMEDIALTRVLPNLTVVVPCDQAQMEKATIATGEMMGPVYLRSSRYSPLQLTTDQTQFEIGKAQIFKPGNDVTVIACGIMVAEAMKAADVLASKHISVRVINLHTIKPIDRETILNAAEETKAIVTAEEHQLAGGMGSAVAECLAQYYPAPIEMVGLKDTFGESGPANELLEKYHLTSQDIIQAIQKVLSRK